MTDGREVTVSAAQIELQRAFLRSITALNREREQAGGGQPTAFVRSYGCQQNFCDGEKLGGMLDAAGYKIIDDPEAAEVVVYNTCAIRERAEDRIYGNTGALTASKKANPDKIICLCGCMVQQKSSAEKFKKSFPLVDMLVGTHALHEFPRLLYEKLQSRERLFFIPDSDGLIAEGLPVLRESRFSSGVPVSYGCDNFCTYCVVPGVRGRERSRDPAAVLEEVAGLAANGCREITLLGQNVNSYGLDRAGSMEFPELLRKVCAFEGDYWVKFMTSHPKDAGEALFAAIGESKKAAKHLHLPVQSGSDAVLKAMSRKYTAAEYMAKIEAARKAVPGLTVTSDVIAGFPGETGEDFQKTLDLVETAGFDALFMFMYSKRENTPAAAFENQIPDKVKLERFTRLLRLQEKITERRNREYTGKTVRVLVDRFDEKKGKFYGKNDGAAKVLFDADRNEDLIGSFVDVIITGHGRHFIFGEKL